ncbi:hypothetical protein [Muriicola sp.]|uniref:hypothetical protein n=1 Tax=Muriicola sp. TaxID=2020856 RepID=UPI003C7752BF
MNLIDNVLKLLKRRKEEELKEVPEGFCPNCWGREEYGGQFFKAVKKEGIDINSSNPNRGWIQDYVDKNLSEIRLHQKDDMLICNKCKIAYRPT